MYVAVPFNMLIKAVPPIFMRRLFKATIFESLLVRININKRVKEESPIIPPANASAKYPNMKVINTPSMLTLWKPR